MADGLTAPCRRLGLTRGSSRARSNHSTGGGVLVRRLTLAASRGESAADSFLWRRRVRLLAASVRRDATVVCPRRRKAVASLAAAKMGRGPRASCGRWSAYSGQSPSMSGKPPRQAWLSEISSGCLQGANLICQDKLIVPYPALLSIVVAFFFIW